MGESYQNSVECGKDLKAYSTPIDGLVWYDLPVHGDSRGWFKENWQREKMTSLGLPDLGPVQNNVSFNAEKGATRGIHAEPWDKYISIGHGKIFGAWVDLREGEGFGTTFTLELDPSKAIFVPRGVGNSFQALEDNTVYMYLVNDHWSSDAQNLYTFLNLNDKSSNIKWPIPLSKAELSDKDKAHPQLSDVTPMKPRNILVTGTNTEIGIELEKHLPYADFITSDDIDITSDHAETARNWRQYDIIINASEYSSVDAAEKPSGREDAWRNNVKAVANLTRIASRNQLTLIHLSSDYVFDGTSSSYDDDALPSPLNAYGQTKAAAEAVAGTAPAHYIIRSGWMVGETRTSFVDRMIQYSSEGLSPRVVNDQIGRLTFADDLAKFIVLIIDNIRKNTPFEYGTYNFTSDGKPASWADIAKRVYALSGSNEEQVTGITTEEYLHENKGVAQRPLSSVLQLDKVKLSGAELTNWEQKLEIYVENKMKEHK